MDAEEAKFILEDPDGKKLSEIGEAIDVLLPQYRPKNRTKGGYKWLSEKIGKVSGYKRSFTPSKLSKFHSIYRLPQGIRWKIDLEKIGASQGVEIARLKSEEDQWVLALAVDAKQMSAKDCRAIVNLVPEKPEAGEKNYSLREALGIVSGIRFRDIPRVMEMLSPEEWIAVSKEAWNRKMDWQDFFHRLATEKQSVLSDIEKRVEQISRWMRDFPKSSHEEMDQKLQSLAKIADELRNLAELRQPAAEEAVQKPEAEEKEKPNDVGDSGENPSGSSEKVDVEKAINVPSSGDESKSPKPSGDRKQLLLNDDVDKPKGKRKKKSPKKSKSAKKSET